MSESDQASFITNENDKLHTQFIESQIFWGRKWVNYLAIGNGGALLACTSASLQSNDNAQILLPSAWWFFGGLIAAGAIAKLRFVSVSRAGRLFRISKRPRADFVGLDRSKSSIKGQRTFKVQAFESLTLICETISSMSFLAGIGLALIALSN